MADLEVFKITSEEDALALLERALNGQFGEDDFPLVAFDKWPVVDVYLPNTPVDASMTPTMMAAFIELQEAVYRAHKLINFDTANLRTLSKSERETYEFRVKVNPGSSGYLADLGGVLTKIGTEAVSKMTPEGIVMVALGTALIVGGTISWKAWLKSRADIRKAEIEAEVVQGKAQLDQAERLRFFDVIDSQTASTERGLSLLAQAISRNPVLGDIEAATEPARLRLVRAISDEKGGTVGGVKLDADTAAEVTHAKRSESVEETISGNFRVAKVDTTVPDGFRVTLSRDGYDDVVASVLDVMKSEQQRALLRDAEWSKKPIFVEVTARRLRSRIVDAIIEDVRPIENNDAA